MEDDPIDFNPPTTAKTIDVNFDFMTARNEFDMSLRPFIAGVFDQDCPVVALAESIAMQTEIGTFLVTDATDKPEDNLIGFITLLPIVQGSHLNYPHVYLGAKGDISMINNSRAALFLCERVINMPSELIPHLHNQLILDLEWAEGNCEGLFCYDYVVSLSRCISTMPQTGAARKKRKTVVPDNLLFFRLEDEIMLRYAEESFLFESEASRSGYTGKSTDDTCSHKLVMIFSMRSFKQALQEVIKSYSSPS
ncbi:hypothetical protein SteCoe_3360 [Stentor coeruleus]|uniref:Uncharacterized protein n=1 Tax=Stentor coeruleus TaxID=5963 RepID=A0A1R2CXG8_9CILI|nr:hypothetical protein SteCoe_3360 [Stentor coeruleus]